MRNGLGLKEVGKLDVGTSSESSWQREQQVREEVERQQRQGGWSRVSGRARGSQ